MSVVVLNPQQISGTTALHQQHQTTAPTAATKLVHISTARSQQRWVWRGAGLLAHNCCLKFNARYGHNMSLILGGNSGFIYHSSPSIRVKQKKWCDVKICGRMWLLFNSGSFPRDYFYRHTNDVIAYNLMFIASFARMVFIDLIYLM